MAASSNTVSRRALRLRPAIVLVIVQWLLWAVVPVVAPDAALIGMIGGLLCGLLIILWWLFLSRAPWLERVGAIAFMVLGMIVTRQLVHESIAGAGMGRLLFVFSIPALTLALVAGATIGSRFAEGGRRLAIAVAILLACGAFTLLRTDGVSGAGSQMHWRWTPTAEERLLAQAPEPLAMAPPAAPAPPAVPAAPAAIAAASPAISTLDKSASTPMAPAPKPVPEWPGFRGPDRDGVVRGVRLETDWVKSPPVELWHRAIGPGWSSFAVSGDRLYTQEQRGEHEIVACYQVSTGKPVWQHRDAVRFYESNAGPGPRATPTVSDGRVYAFGATGILNVLDAANGALVWTRNVASATKTEIPLWAFASSPVVTDDLVIVAAAGTLAAYDRASGNHRWTGPKRGFSYSSPHRARLGGVDQILLLSPPGVVSVATATGELLWEHTWDGGAIVQPGFTADGDVLINSISMTGGQGMRRLAVTRDANTWKVDERWTSTGLKPYFNDFVVHKGHAYGFDGSILSSIDLTDGKRKWKGGRYGNGQLILLADQDVLLVLSEEGELALVSATPDEFKELARVSALEGKTWNHPVLIRDLLLVRNGEEMAAFRLASVNR
jgi:outer membrane protein assembly factor BamB